MEEIDYGTILSLKRRAKKMKSYEDCLNWCKAWCKTNNADFHRIWLYTVLPAFREAEFAYEKERHIQAITNTFKYFPTQDLERIKRWGNSDISKNIKIKEVNGEWKVSKIFGVEVRVDNPECRCFALRHIEENEGADGKYRFLALLTTFDFKTARFEGSDKSVNLVWGCGYDTKFGPFLFKKQMPRCYYLSLIQFLNTYKDFADEEFDPNKLVIVDDTPQNEQEYLLCQQSE